MDSSLLSGNSGTDLSKLSDSDKRDLQQQVGNEMQKAKIQECLFFSVRCYSFPLSVKICFLYVRLSFLGWCTTDSCLAKLAVHNLTDICWTKCITGGISSGKLSSKEETCTQNCVERFLDANVAVLNHLEKLRLDMQ